jgi:uncharacterized membrane protein (DUF2068 family)
MPRDHYVRPLPGTGAARFRPRFHYELIVCGLRGHELVGLDAASVRPGDHAFVRESGSLRWHRCLRCDSWLPLAAPTAPTREFPPDRDAIELPLRGKALRDKLVLRVIAVDRALHFVVLALLALLILLFERHRLGIRDVVYRFEHAVGGGPLQTSREHGLLHRLDSLLTVGPTAARNAALAVGAYAILEGVEAVGLWFQRRWAEYLTLIATAAFLPFEVRELIDRITAFRVIGFLLNVAVVVYLLYAKRLFGIRGGGAAELAERRRDMTWEAVERMGPEAVAGATQPPQAPQPPPVASG